MSETPPPRNVVPQDQAEIQFMFSDITASPVHKRMSPRTQSIDAKLRRKWKKQVEREKAYEREKEQRAKQQGAKQQEEEWKRALIEQLTKDLLVPCVEEPCADKAKLEASYEAPLPDSALQNLSNSLIIADELPVVTPDEKPPSDKPETASETSKDGQLYSPQEQEYSNFDNSQLYAPHEQDYQKFLQNLESESVDPSLQEKDFADWLQKKVDKELQPIAPDASAELKASKRVAFSTETTVRFFSRTREELLQLRRRYKRTINRGASEDDDSSDDEEDWPLFRYLDKKLKDLEESKAWDDPMAAVADMFVSKEMKDKISPIICVCDDRAASTNVKETDMNNSLADLDDEELEPAMAVAASRAAAAVQMADERDQSQESNASGHSPLWFAVPYKSATGASEEPADFIHPALSPTSSTGTDKTGKASSRDKTSGPVLTMAPKSLSLIKESTEDYLSKKDGPVNKSAVSADPDAPREASLSWLADELDDSHEESGKSPLSTDPLDGPRTPNRSNLSIGSLGRNTNSKLLKQVSEHLNLSALSAGSSVSREDSATMPHDESILSHSTNNTTTSSMELKSAAALKELFEKPDGTSDKQSISVSVADIDKLVRPSETNPGSSLQDSEASTNAKASAVDDTEDALLYDDADSWSSKETPFDQRRAASQTTSGSLQAKSAFGGAHRRKQVETVKAAKRWVASQKAGAKTQKSSPERGPDLDESRNRHVENPAAAVGDVSRSFNGGSNVWEGIINDSTDRGEEARAEKQDIVFDYASKTEKDVNSSPWFAAEAGPDLDESKAWEAFTYEEPDMTNTTGSASHGEAEEWVAFPSDNNPTEQAWAETFPADEDPPKARPIRTSPKKQGPSLSNSPRKQIRAAPAQSSRVKALASQFERQGGRKSPESDWGISPLTPASPWTDNNRKNKEYTREYADLQQPVLDESRSDSNQSSPVSVTHL